MLSNVFHRLAEHAVIDQFEEILLKAFHAWTAFGCSNQYRASARLLAETGALVGSQSTLSPIPSTTSNCDNKGCTLFCYGDWGQVFLLHQDSTVSQPLTVGNMDSTCLE